MDKDTIRIAEMVREHSTPGNPYRHVQTRESPRDPIDIVRSLMPWGLDSRPPTAQHVLQWLAAGCKDLIWGMICGRKQDDVSPGGVRLYDAHGHHLQLGASGCSVDGAMMVNDRVTSSVFAVSGQDGLTTLVDPAKVSELEFRGGLLVRVIPRV